MKPQSAAEQKNSIHDIRGPFLNKPQSKGRGRPPKDGAKPKAGRSWSRKTVEYVKIVTEGKGAPCKIWSLKEKKNLLQGLQKYSHQDWDSLCKLIPTRTKQEIQEYIQNLKGGEFNKSKPKEDAHLTWAPIESWLDMCSEMVHYEQIDLSSVLGRVFSVIGHFESFPQTSNISPELVPDYGKLYRYIAAIMDESLTMPELSPLESAIIADLMHSIGDNLRMSDTSLQRKVMCWKYKMLNYKFEYDNVRGSLDRIRKALTNDFSDLQRDNNRGVSGLPSFTQGSTSGAEETVSLRTSDGQPGGSSSLASNTHNSNVPDGETPSSQAGTASGSESVLGLSGASDSQQNSPEKASNGNEAKPKRKRGRPRIHHWRRPIEKPRLFTMNPFCVPIRLLRLKSLLAGAAGKRAASAGTVVAQPSATGSSTHSVSSVASDQPLSRKELSIRMESNQAQVTNSLRQVTGLYIPKTFKTNKKFVNQSSVSVHTKRAISEALARRSREKEVARSYNPPGAGSGMIQVPESSSSTNPPQSFRCVSLHDGRMAVVPVHLDDAATLSQVHMKQAMPVPRQMPTLKACPALQSTSQQSSRVAEGSTVASVHAPEPSIDTSDNSNEQAWSTQSTLHTPTFSSSRHISPSKTVTFQMDPAQQTSASVGKQPVASQKSVHRPSQSEGRPQSQQETVRATPAPPRLTGPASAQPSAQPVSSSTTQSGYCRGTIIIPPSPDASSMQVAQIIPQKRRKYKNGLNTTRTTTTEIIVPLPPVPVIRTETTASDTKESTPPKSKPKTKQPKISQPKAGKSLAPKNTEKTSNSEKSKNSETTSENKKASQSRTVKGKQSGSQASQSRTVKGKQSGSQASQSRTVKGKQSGSQASQSLTVKGKQSGSQASQSHTVKEKQSGSQASQSHTVKEKQSGSQSSRASKRKQSVPKQKKTVEPKDSASDVSTVQKANPTAESESPKVSENRDSGTLCEDSSPHVNISGLMKTYSRGHAAKEPRPISGQDPVLVGSVLPQSSQPVGQKTQSLKQVNSNSSASVGEVTFQPGSSQEADLSGYIPQTAIELAPQTSGVQTPSVPAADRVPSAKNEKNKPVSRTALALAPSSPRVSSAKTNSNQTAMPSPSPSSSTVPQSSSNSKQVTKTSKDMQELSPWTQPPLSRRGRKRKAGEPTTGRQRKAVKTVENPQPSAPVQSQRKKAVKEPVAKKRPANFLALEDISQMTVEIVTPEDARGRLLASLNSELDNRRQKNSGGAQKRAREATLNVVVDDDEISLVNI